MKNIHFANIKQHSLFERSSIVKDEAALIRRAIIGVLQNAQNGYLPLCTWTLGMPQYEFMFMLKQNFPELAYVEEMSLTHFNMIKNTMPYDFFKLSHLLYEERSLHKDGQQALWLSKLICAASYGNRDLWVEMGLANQRMLSFLIQQYFPSISYRHASKTMWKETLFDFFK